MINLGKFEGAICVLKTLLWYECVIMYSDFHSLCYYPFSKIYNVHHKKPMVFID